MPWGDFVVGEATILLAYATFFLGYAAMGDSILNREHERDLAAKDRRRLRLKEQLEGLYSPLMSYIDILDNIKKHKSEPFYSIMQKFKNKFEFLAEEDLKDLLREYYHTDLYSLSKDEWNKLINPMMDAIGNGCMNISLEYDDLTRKVT